jgi:hypothetical protein
MKIYATLDCIIPSPFERLIMATIKGVLYDYMHSRPEKRPEDVFEWTTEYHLTVKKSDNNMICFLLQPLNGSSPTTPVGLFEDVKKLIEPVAMGFTMHGGFYPADGSTSFVIQRFEIKYQTFHGWVAE